MFGDAPVLYDLLGCTNPTRIDRVTAVAITRADADTAMAAVHAHPSDYLVVHE